jgi:hypothetical protein
VALKQKEEVKKEAPETTALTLFGGLVDQPLSTMVEPEGREYLPFFKLPYGVESLTIPVLDDKGQPLQNKGQPVMQSATGKMVISMGKDKLQALPVPYILTAICIRGATRQTVEKDGKKTYVRTLVPVGKNADGTYKAPSAKHSEQMVASGIKGSGVDAGNSILAVALFEQDGKPTACVGLMECFKTLTKYFTEPLKSGLLNEGYGIKVTVEDHTVNTTQSKAGFYYFDSRKFNQWSRVQLSKEQVTLICETLRAKQAACDAWLKREE